jgi:hypothetical protein
VITNAGSIETSYLVGKHFSCLFVDAELGSLLVRLLHDAVLHLTVHPLVSIDSVNLEAKVIKLSIVVVYGATSNLSQFHQTICAICKDASIK